MPPKTKFTKEEIVDAAYEILRVEGEEALTAREVGKRLGTSSSPIFTVFSSMGELKDAALKKATDKFIEYMNVADEYYPAYKKRGMQWIKFAKDEPVLFGILFMKRNVGDGERAFFLHLKVYRLIKERTLSISYMITMPRRIRLSTCSGRCGFFHMECAFLLLPVYVIFLKMK